MPVVQASFATTTYAVAVSPSERWERHRDREDEESTERGAWWRVKSEDRAAPRCAVHVDEHGGGHRALGARHGKVNFSGLLP